MTLVLRRIESALLTPDDHLDGVLKADTQVAAARATDVLARAHAEARDLLDAARARADGELQQRREALERQLWESAAGYARSLQDEWSRSLSELESRIGQVLVQALRRMAGELPAQDRLHACVRQLMQEAGSPDGGVLLVSADAHAAVREMADGLPWPVQSSDDVPAGTVRLVAAQGRWECALDTVIDQLAAALGATAHPPEEPTHA